MPILPDRPGRRSSVPYVGARTYQLIVEGELTDRMGVVFEGMTLTRAEGNTRLVGKVRDQAALQGLLQRVSDLGLTLLEVIVVEPESARA